MSYYFSFDQDEVLYTIYLFTTDYKNKVNQNIDIGL